MATRAQVVAEAMSWLDTPFKHQGRAKGAGVDCVGVIIGVAKVLGISEYDLSDYGPQPHPERMRKELVSNLNQITFEQVREGSILWFRPQIVGRHLGVVTSINPMFMVHATSDEHIKRCVRQRIDKRWVKRIVGCFDYRGLED